MKLRFEYHTEQNEENGFIFIQITEYGEEVKVMYPVDLTTNSMIDIIMRDITIKLKEELNKNG